MKVAVKAPKGWGSFYVHSLSLDHQTNSLLFAVLNKAHIEMLHEKRGRREEHCDHRKGENNDAERQIANEAQQHREHQRVAAAD